MPKAPKIDPSRSEKAPSPAAPPARRPVTAGSRRRLAIALGTLVLGGLAVHSSTRLATRSLRALPEYAVSPQSVSLTPPPPWVRSDVRQQAFAAAGLGPDAPQGAMSILDPPERLEQRIGAALALHPWVSRVGTITKRPPNLVAVEVEYRRPVAAVVTGGGFVPVDGTGVALPAADFTPEELGWMPRVEARPLAEVGTGAAQPRVGEPWPDARVLGAVALVTRLGTEWASFRLLDVLPSRGPEVRGDFRYATYDLRATSGTVIEWGAAPGFAPADEPTFEEKLGRLRAYVAAKGPLDSVATTDAWITVRRKLETRPRVARKEPPAPVGGGELVK